MLKCVSLNKRLTYVGYTNNLKRRILLHNSNKGAKFTKGKKWKLIYSKKFISRTKAMSYEFLLKNDKLKRDKIYKNN